MVYIRWLYRGMQKNIEKDQFAAEELSTVQSVHNNQAWHDPLQRNLSSCIKGSKSRTREKEDCFTAKGA